MPERTYLRIRRRRNAVSAPMIQLGGLDQDESSSFGLDELRLEKQAASLQDKQQQMQSPPPAKKAKTILWRRISISSECLLPISCKKRDFRVVDAILDEEDDDPQEQLHKRRRLTLVEGGGDSAHTHRTLTSSCPKSRRKSYVVLNPCERLVDDSLQQVISGTKSVVEHFDLCNTDPRLCQASRKWFAWRNAECGNLLHACALWNEVNMVNELLSRDLVSMADAVDGDGRTPKEVAELCGHSLIVDLLQQIASADDEDYVFDLYCVDGEAPSKVVDDNPTASPLDCELHGGVGYWDENGKLVLNLIPRSMSEVSVADEDELDDSNREDWNGNDYPDDDDGGDSFSCDEEQDELINFRQYPANLRGAFDGDDDEDDFDAAYGIYGQNEPEYECEA